MESEITLLVEKDKALRTYTNLPVIDKNIRKLGTGGRRSFNSKELDKLASGNDNKISTLTRDIDKLARELKFEKISYEKIYNAFMYRSNQVQSIPSIRPVNIGYITDGFGFRKDPFTKQRDFHTGIDISAPSGTPVYATADGTVGSVKLFKGYGKTLKLDHGFNYKSVYAHLSKILVKPESSSTA